MANYDAIVVGARCAGSPTAMLLARKGYKVLVVDRANFPSDTMSTHLIHPQGVEALERWGLLDELLATWVPPIREYLFDFGPVTLQGTAGTERSPVSYSPRRTVLDKILVDAAVHAGAEVREAFTVEAIEVEDGRVTGIRGHARGGKTVTETAPIVIGADGRHSLVAKAVGAEQYNEKPTHSAQYYTYWSDLPTDMLEAHIRLEHGRGFGVMPTHDGLTLIVSGWPRAEFDANRKDVEGNYMKSFELVPEFAERVHAATREARIIGTGDLPFFFRKPYGPGWALVGDAGYHKDPITAQGISDAFRDAELVANALDASSNGSSFEAEMVNYQHTRDEHVAPHYEFTSQMASFAPPPPEMQQLMGAMVGNQKAMDGFAGVYANTVPVPEFFSEENVGRIFAAAGAVAGQRR